MDLLTFILAAGICMLSCVWTIVAVLLSIKLYTEIKEKVIASRVKPEHKCKCSIKTSEPVCSPVLEEKVIIKPPQATIKGVPLREAVALAKQIIRRRGQRY